MQWSLYGGTLLNANTHLKVSQQYSLSDMNMKLSMDPLEWREKK